MLKTIIHFFRKKNIRKNMQLERMLHFPDMNNFPVVSILLDENQKKNIKEMELFIKSAFRPKKLRFVMIADSLPENLLQSEYMVFILKEDFNRLGVLKKEKEDVLATFSDELFINLSDNNENLLNDYLVSFVKSSFKIGHSKVNMNMYDLIIDYGDEKNDVARLKILYKYLLMLSGNKNEN